MVNDVTFMNITPSISLLPQSEDIAVKRAQVDCDDWGVPKDAEGRVLDDFAVAENRFFTQVAFEKNVKRWAMNKELSDTDVEVTWNWGARANLMTSEPEAVAGVRRILCFFQFRVRTDFVLTLPFCLILL